MSLVSVVKKPVAIAGFLTLITLLTFFTGECKQKGRLPFFSRAVKETEVFFTACSGLDVDSGIPQALPEPPRRRLFFLLPLVG